MHDRPCLMAVFTVLVLLGGCSDEGNGPSPDNSMADVGPPDGTLTDHALSDQMHDTPVADAGPPRAFGETCGELHECGEGLDCMYIVETAPEGFCTKPCTTPQQPCEGATDPAVAYCLIRARDNNYYCGFMCQVKDGEGTLYNHPCPSGLTCSTVERPAGSGMKYCIP